MYVGISQDFYYRESPGYPLVGPMSYYFALKGAQYLSQLKGHTGVAEVCTYVGNRIGDPPGPPRLFVMHTYMRGKLTLSGRMAMYNSKVRYGNPPPIS